LKKEKDHIKNIRVDYNQGTLEAKDLDPNPINLFEAWMHIAINADISEPNAMTLSTASLEGQPSSRVVLLKDVENGSFIFFTNYDSRKGIELASNPKAALVFFWREIGKQVRIEGLVKKIDPGKSTTYFQSRPKGSQIGAHASNQSQVIDHKNQLEKKVLEIEATYADEAHLPRPANWGGYQLKPAMIEFWQGRPSRLHDRFQYTKVGEKWEIVRLAP